eukprot:GILI01013425.1.p1 GENE.GILI01013425.1~~GILI01013425.1.p1  ORF type:complete len:753 (-),score=158.05 GILI01013425.1:80-2011(-)
MLDSEVHRLKAMDRTQKEGLERFERDEKRLTVLLSMSRDQLDQFKVRNDRLLVDCDARQKEIEALKQKNDILEKKFRLATEDKQAFKVMCDNNSAAEKALLAKLQLENQLQKDTIERCRKEAISAEDSRKEERDLVEVERRKAFEMRVALETRLRTVEEELGFIQEMRQKDTKTATTREYDLSVLVQQLKREVNDLRGTQESVTRNTFESTNAVRTENMTLNEKCRMLETQLSEVTRTSFEKVTQLQTHLDAKSELLEQQEASAKAREKVAETQIQKFIADLRVAQGEVNDLAARENTKNEEQVTKIIKLSSDLNATSQHLVDVLQEVDTLKARIRQHEVNAIIANENATNLLSRHQREYAEKYSQKTAELNNTTVELQWKSEKLAATEARLHQTAEVLESAKEKHYNESNAFRNEIEGYKGSVAKLNFHIEANVENKLLLEQNQNLQQQIVTLKNQLGNMNNALSKARVEVDIADNHRSLVLMDQLDSQLARLNILEKERLEGRPLLDKLAMYFKGASAAGVNVPHIEAGGSADSAGNTPPHNRVSSAGANKNVSFGQPTSPSKQATLSSMSNNLPLRLTYGQQLDISGVEAEGLQQRSEESAIHRSIDNFYRRYGGGSLDFPNSSLPTLPSIPTSKIKRVN